MTVEAFRQLLDSGADTGMLATLRKVGKIGGCDARAGVPDQLMLSCIRPGTGRQASPRPGLPPAGCRGAGPRPAGKSAVRNRSPRMARSTSPTAFAVSASRCPSTLSAASALSAAWGGTRSATSPRRCLYAARALYAGLAVASRQERESGGMTVQHPVLPDLRRDYIEQPGYCGLGEARSPRRVHLTRPFLQEAGSRRSATDIAGYPDPAQSGQPPVSLCPLDSYPRVRRRPGPHRCGYS